MEFRLLRADEIDVKVKQVFEKGAVALLYKTARTDMAILDETFGILNWTDDYKEIKGNLYCGIGVREKEDQPFIYKWDCGIESREDGEGNEKKGEASDAFKRAGSKLGIGRELYTAPFIFLNVETKVQKDKDGKEVCKNGKPVYVLADKFQSFYVSEIEYDEYRNIKVLEVSDDKDNAVYVYGKNKKAPRKIEKKNNEDGALTYEDALKMTLKNKQGADVSLGSFSKEELERLTKTDNPEWEELRKGATLILEVEAKNG